VVKAVEVGLVVKKLLIFLLGSILFVIVYMFLLSGMSFQLERVEGCYTQESVLPIDKICLYTDGKYEQLSIPEGKKNFEVYNSGGWRSYSTKENDHRIIDVNLSGFFDRFGDSSELDISPYKNMFGKVLFMVGGDRNGGDRYYIRED
jgi:hypothetical protein